MESALTGFPLVGQSGVHGYLKWAVQIKFLVRSAVSLFSWISICSASVFGPDIKLGFLSETSSFFEEQWKRNLLSPPDNSMLFVCLLHYRVKLNEYV